jgi:hypothetical protein
MSALVSYLPKASGTNQPGSGKYYINCSRRVTKDTPTTESWLEVIERLKPTNFQDSNRVLLGVLEKQKQKQVVIKLGDGPQISKEYNVGENLVGIPGFIKYVCYFECNDDYKRHDGVVKTSLCKGPGTSMKCLIMKYYPKGSVGSFKWDASNFHILKVVVTQCFMSLMMAFEQKGVVHNDAHARNVLMEPTNKQTIQYIVGGKSYDVPTLGYRIVIMDFENALVSTDKISGREFVYKDMERLVSDLYFVSNIRLSKELKDTIDTLTRVNPPFNKAIAPLLTSLAKSEWSATPPLNANLVYNPNVFG